MILVSFKQSLCLKCASVEREEHLVDRDSSEPVGQTLYSRVRFDRNLATIEAIVAQVAFPHANFARLTDCTDTRKPLHEEIFYGMSSVFQRF